MMLRRPVTKADGRRPCEPTRCHRRIQKSAACSKEARYATALPNSLTQLQTQPSTVAGKPYLAVRWAPAAAAAPPDLLLLQGSPQGSSASQPCVQTGALLPPKLNVFSMQQRSEACTTA
jgi:hypothetical protein